MNVDVKLIVIVLDSNELYVLLKDRQVPTLSLTGFNNSFDAVEQIIKESMNIIGKWLEVQPKITGVLDDVSRVDSGGNRLVSIIYNLCLPAKNRLNEPYEWIDFGALESINIAEEDKNVIRYTSINI